MTTHPYLLAAVIACGSAGIIAILIIYAGGVAIANEQEKHEMIRAARRFDDDQG